MPPRVPSGIPGQHDDGLLATADDVGPWLKAWTSNAASPIVSGRLAEYTSLAASADGRRLSPPARSGQAGRVPAWRASRTSGTPGAFPCRWGGRSAARGSGLPAGRFASDGRGIRRLTTDDTADRALERQTQDRLIAGPAIDPVHERIAFIRPAGQHRLQVMDADGSLLTMAANLQYGRPGVVARRNVDHRRDHAGPDTRLSRCP